MGLRLGPALPPQHPPILVQLLSDLFVLPQVLLYCLQHQAEIIASLFCEVAQGTPNQRFLRVTRCLLSGFCTMHQRQVINKVIFVCAYLGTENEKDRQLRAR